jgi:hypothetical protein
VRLLPPMALAEYTDTLLQHVGIDMWPATLVLQQQHIIPQTVLWYGG